MGIVDRIREALGGDTQRAWKGTDKAIAPDAADHAHSGLFRESPTIIEEHRPDPHKDREIVADIEHRWTDYRPQQTPKDFDDQGPDEWQAWLERREAKLKEVESHPLISQARVLAFQYREAEPWHWCRSDDGSQYPAPSDAGDNDVVEHAKAEILAIRDRLASEFGPRHVERALEAVVLDELRADWEFEHGTDCDGRSFYEPAGRRGDGLIRQIESATRRQELSALSEQELSAYKRVIERRRDNDWRGDCHDSARENSRILDDIAAVEENRMQTSCQSVTEQHEEYDPDRFADSFDTPEEMYELEEAHRLSGAVFEGDPGFDELTPEKFMRDNPELFNEALAEQDQIGAQIAQELRRQRVERNNGHDIGF